MNKKALNMATNMALLVVFILTLVSGFAAGASGSRMIILVHAMLGTTFVAGELLHLALHRDWIKAVVLRWPGNLPEQVRDNRTVILLQLGFLAICSLTGFILMAVPGTHGLGHIHGMTGMGLAIATAVHLARTSSRMRARSNRRPAVRETGQPANANGAAVSQR
jgi:hypothetical protein